MDLTGAVLGERWQLGTALFEVTAPRIPCAAFVRSWDVPDLVKRFSAHGATGAYLRVLEPGKITTDDSVEVAHRPLHGITTLRAFRALTSQQYRLPELAPALTYLPQKNQPGIAAKIAARSPARI